MASVTLTDGGWVEWVHDGGSLRFQKYDASGARVGAEHSHQAQIDPAFATVVALSNGGYVAVTGFQIRGYFYDLRVYDAASNAVTTIDAPGSGLGIRVAASPSGGFLVASMERQTIYPSSAGVDYQWQPLLTLYDNAGAVVRGPVGLAGDLANISVLPNGAYRVTWADGSLSRALEIDPRNPPSFPEPAPPTGAVLWDDQGANTGAFEVNTTDTTPEVRVPVTQTGTLVTEVGSRDKLEAELAGGVQVTAEDVARGYVDVPVGLSSGFISGQPLKVWIRFKSDQGVPSDPVTKSLTVYRAAEIYSVTDDAGAQTGPVPPGGTTDDATLTVRVGIESSGKVAGDTLPLFASGIGQVGSVTLTAEDVSRGFVDVTTSPIADGQRQLWVQPAPVGYWDVTVQGGGASSGSGQVITSPGPGSTLQGGNGADTLIASQGPDVLTGAGGGDAFVYRALPWNAGRITDFALGSDRIDLSAIFQSSGYTGSDPVADGRMRFDSDGAGGTRLYFDRDAPNSGDWPFLVTTLQNVSPSGLTWAQLSGGGAPPPPTGGSTLSIATATVSAGEGNSGEQLFRFAVTRSGDASGQASVNWSVAGGAGDPAEATDFIGGVMPSGALIFPAGETLRYVEVRVAADVIHEHSEAFKVQLSGAIGATLGAASAEGRIINDDTVSVAILSGNASPTEGDAGLEPRASYGIHVLGRTETTFTVDWGVGGAGDNPATEADFGGSFPAGSLTFAPGDTQEDVYLRIQGDTVVELDEGFYLALASSTTEGVQISLARFDALIRNDDTGAPPTNPSGQVITSPGPGSTVAGGPGNDTLIASQGPDVLTGGGGGDAFVYRALPWNAGRITDFAVGSDRLDLSAIFQSSGYTGSDPVADGRMRFDSDGAGGTRLYFDRDAPSGGDWPFLITTLQNVSPSGLTWAQLSGGAQPPPPPPSGDGQVLTWDQHGDTLTGGSGNDTLNASRGPDRLTGNGGGDQFVYRDLPWNAGHITDFDKSVDKLDISALFDAYPNGIVLQRADGAGNLQVYFDRDGDERSGDWPFLIVTLDGQVTGGSGWLIT